MKTLLLLFLLPYYHLVNYQIDTITTDTCIEVSNNSAIYITDSLEIINDLNQNLIFDSIQCVYYKGNTDLISFCIRFENNKVIIFQHTYSNSQTESVETSLADTKVPIDYTHRKLNEIYKDGYIYDLTGKLIRQFSMVYTLSLFLSKTRLV